MKRKFEIEVFSKFNYELEKKWTSLEKESNITIFQTYNWQKYWSLNCGYDFKIVNTKLQDLGGLTNDPYANSDKLLKISIDILAKQIDRLVNKY